MAIPMGIPDPIGTLGRIKGKIQADLATMQDPLKTFGSLDADITQLKADLAPLTALSPIMAELVDTMQAFVLMTGRLAAAHADLRGTAGNDAVPSAPVAPAMAGTDSGPVSGPADVPAVDPPAEPV